MRSAITNNFFYTKIVSPFKNRKSQLCCTKINFNHVYHKFFPSIIKRAKIKEKIDPRGTTLRNEGDFFASTEYSNYVPFYGLHRSELRRRGTSLRLEGELATSTEKNEQFVEWPTESLRRPDPVKVPSNLKLEGDLEIGTECRDKYVPFVGARRPDILRQSSQLRMEGNARWTPEYTDVFRDHNGVGKIFLFSSLRSIVSLERKFFA